ncbi:MAG: hypothetical protein ACQGVK_21555 [Myxococcota bacterium]
MSSKSIGERVQGEIREIGLVSLYFLAFFLLFLSLKALLLDEYSIQTSVLGTAVVGALIVAKVVVLLEKTSFGGLLDSHRAIYHVLWRSLAYTAAVFVVTLAEHLFEYYRATGDLSSALGRLRAGEGLDHVLALNLSVGTAFVLYNVFAELERDLGPGGLRRVLLERRDRADAQASD